MNKVFLIEDHDEALKIWREKKVKAVDLVHIDAHLDFGIHLARPLKKIFNEAESLKELKRNLEQSLSFMRYETDFDKQTNIGNYIYPAIEEGIIKDFYWVIPGGLKEFKESAKIIKNIIKAFARQGLITSGYRLQKGICFLELLGRRFVICILDKLPQLKEKVLLDIDTDLLVIESLIVADSTQKIGERKLWISPRELANNLENKKIKPQVVTIAYSVNGGYTPMIYKHLGDEIAYNLSPEDFKEHFIAHSEAARCFNLFSRAGKKQYYQEAIKINPSYRAEDNNYGPLYLRLRKFARARKEFLRILKVDPINAACLLGLGNIALAKREFKKARNYFMESLKNSMKSKIFIKVRVQALLKLAEAEFNLNRHREAKRLLNIFRTLEPRQPYSYYLLGCIYEKEKDSLKAINYYKDSIRLGYGGIKILSRLLKLSMCVKENHDIINFISTNYKWLKRGYLSSRNSGFKKKTAKKLQRLESKINILKKTLKRG